jgi:hypothetical protein
VLEARWGDFVPTKIGEDKKTRNSFLACTLLSSVNKKKYGKAVRELNNAFLHGQDNYPRSVGEAVTMLSHFMYMKTTRGPD